MLERRPSPSGNASGRIAGAMMARARATSALASAALLMAAMTSCSDGDLHEVTTRPAPPSNSHASRSDSSSLLSESEIASEAASNSVRQFFATVDLLRQTSKHPETDLEAVASSTELTAQKNLLTSQREGGLKQVGETKLVEVDVESVSLDSPVTAVVDVCWDVSAVDILDGAGESVVTPERSDVGWTRLTVTNESWNTEPTDGWRVSGGSDLEKEPCVGS